MGGKAGDTSSTVTLPTLPFSHTSTPPHVHTSPQGVPMRAEILSIGTELLLGHTVDTNAVTISQALAELGISLTHRVTVGDNRERLMEALRAAASRADL